MYSSKETVNTARGNSKGVGVFFQPKLTVNQPNDRYEQEADAMADRVMRMPRSNGAIQRKCAHCEEEEKQIHRKPANPSAPDVDEQFESYVSSLSGRGAVLSQAERNFFEPRFGRDFSDVRIHTGGDAAQSAERVNALAYTTGNNIVFNTGQYQPGSEIGQRLMAHELTHVVQQGGRQLGMVQAEFALEPTTPLRRERTLTPEQIQQAITYNQAKFNNADELALVCDILGVTNTPAVIDEDFVAAVLSFQHQFGLFQDGRVGGQTAQMLAREIAAERDFVGEGNSVALDSAFSLHSAISALILADNRTYADYRDLIRPDTDIKKFVALNDRALLVDLRGKLSRNNWARCIELLGRDAPSANRLLQHGVVRGAMNNAWADSDVGLTCAGGPTAAHEEGGWVYMNLLTGEMATRRAAAGAQAAINLWAPPTVADSIIVATFHTHPNVGACWGAPFASPADVTNANDRGVPSLVIGAFPDVATTAFVTGGPNRRLHIAGDVLFPGTAGGISPQSKLRGEIDDE